MLMVRSPSSPLPVAPQARNLTQDEYAMNHPAGRIGKRLILRVSDVMLTGEKVPKVAAHVKVTTALQGPSCYVAHPLSLVCCHKEGLP